jgi:hypothetical protein
MENTIKINDVVSYLFGDTPQYRVIATKERPYKRSNGEIVDVGDFNDYILVRHPLRVGEVNPFLHVPAQHVELISAA